MGQIADLWAAIGLEMQEAKWKRADNLLEVVAGRVKQLAINSALASTDVNKAMDVIGFKAAPKATNKFLGDAGEPTKVSKAMNGLGMAVKSVALAYVGLKGAQMAWGAVEKTLDLGGRLDDLSQQTGIAAESLQRYGFAAKLGGSSLEVLVGGVKKFNAGFQDAAKTGKGPVVDGLRAIGLTVSQVKKSMAKDGLDGAVALVSSKLAKMPEGSKKAAAAMDLFGKTGTELIPTFNGLSDAFAEADELGLIMSNDDVKALADAGDQIDIVKESFGALRNEVVIALLPSIKEVTAAFIAWFKANRQAISEKVVGLVNLLREGFEAIKPVLSAIGAALGFIADHWKVFATIAKVGMWPVIVAAKGLKLILLGLPGLFNAIGQAGVAVGRALVSAFEAVVNFFKMIGGAISDAFHAALDWIIDKVEAVVDGVRWAVGEAKKIGGAIDDFIQGDPEFINNLRKQMGVDPTAVLPAGASAGGGDTSIEIGEFNVTSPNADPKQVADEAVKQFRTLMDDELRKAAT